MRKTFLVAGVAALAIGTTGVAYAQNPDPKIDVTTSVSPGKGGTKSKPKNTQFKLKVTNDPGSKTTAKTIKVTLPSTLKLSTKGLTQCTASDDEIVNSAGAVCSKAKAGPDGSANAQLLSNGLNVGFKVKPFVGKNELIFYLEATTGNKYAVRGKIKGSTMTIGIGPNLQQPVTGLYAALVDLSTTLKVSKGKNYLFSSTGCKSKKHTVDVTVEYAANPAAPPKPSASGSGDAKCS